MSQIIELLEKAKDHYWDTLEPHKELILKHLEALTLLTQQPPAGELTKKVRNLAECALYDLVPDDKKLLYDLCDRLDAETEIAQKSLEACTLANMENMKLQARLDRAEAINKDLVDNLSMLVALLCHPGSFVSAKDIENAKAAIAKAKKVGGVIDMSERTIQ